MLISPIRRRQMQSVYPPNPRHTLSVFERAIMYPRLLMALVAALVAAATWNAVYSTDGASHPWPNC